MRRAIILLSLAASGCAALPNTIAPELEHMSHATQHAPLTDHPTRYGANIAQVTAQWDMGAAYVSLSEGIGLNRKYPYSYGEIEGPREQFTARIGYQFTVRK